MRWLGARTAAPLRGEAPLAGRVNHLRGSDPARWRTGIPTFARVRYAELYPGIDVVVHGERGVLEHDLLVAPGADASQPRLEIAGADAVALDARGALAVSLAGRSVWLHAPVAFQERDGVRIPVASRWVLDGRQARIAVGAYDRSRPLVIDPVLAYASYFGGDGEDNGGGIHVDASGITIGGSEASSGFGASTGGAEAFAAKLAPGGDSLVWATFFGGSGDEVERDLVVDGAGDAYLFGETTSTDLPTTDGALDASCGSDGLCDGGAPDTFVVKLDGATGAPVFATYLGGSGSDIAGKVAVGAGGEVTLAGYTNSTDLPATPGAYDPTCGTDGACNDVKRDCFAARLDAGGASLVYLTYLGGSAFDRCFGVDVDAAGRAVVVGSTLSPDFPASEGAADEQCGSDGLCDGGDDGFVAMLDADGAELVYATFLGGSGDGDAEVDEYGWAVRVEPDGRVHVVGQTDSADFPTPEGADASYGGGSTDAFVAELDPQGALVTATYLGGAGAEQGFGIALAPSGDVHVTGVTDSADLPLVAPLPGPGNACENCASQFTDAFVATLAGDDGGFRFTSFLGGSSVEYGASIAFAEPATLWVLGDTYSGDFPVVDPLQISHGGGYDAFVARIAVPEPRGALLGIAALGALAAVGRRSRPGPWSALRSLPGPSLPHDTPHETRGRAIGGKTCERSPGSCC
jgi:hypothetical protein